MNVNTCHPAASIVEEWSRRLSVLVALGLTRHRARVRLAAEEPDLYVEYLQAINPQHAGSARLFAERERRAAERRGEQTQQRPSDPPASAGRRTFTAAFTNHRSTIE